MEPKSEEIRIIRILVDQVPGALSKRIEDLGDDILILQVIAFRVLGLKFLFDLFGEQFHGFEILVRHQLFAASQGFWPEWMALAVASCDQKETE